MMGIMTKIFSDVILKPQNNHKLHGCCWLYEYFNLSVLSLGTLTISHYLRFLLEICPLCIGTMTDICTILHRKTLLNRITAISEAGVEHISKLKTPKLGRRPSKQKS